MTWGRLECGQKLKYQVLVPYAKTRLDLNYIIGEMIGELNCGHAYVNPGEVERPNRIKTGLLGAEISRDKSGFFRLEKILPGASWSKSLRSPLTEPGIEGEGWRVYRGDRRCADKQCERHVFVVGRQGWCPDGDFVEQ